MKKLLLFLFVISTISSAKDVDVNRFIFWPRVAVKGKISDSKFGYFLLGDIRINTFYKKEVDGVLKDSITRNIWKTEIITGATWGIKLKKKYPFGLKLLYRPSWNNFSEKVLSEPYYLRHSIEARADLFIPINKFKLHTRLIGWNQFAAEVNSIDYDNEFYTRMLLGGSFSITKKIELLLEEELFLKLTADEDDVDGTEFLNKNMIWAGAKFKINSIINLKLLYVNSITFKENSSTKNVTVVDHYLLPQLCVNIKKQNKK